MKVIMEPCLKNGGRNSNYKMVFEKMSANEFDNLRILIQTILKYSKFENHEEVVDHLSMRKISEYILNNPDKLDD